MQYIQCVVPVNNADRTDGPISVVFQNDRPLVEVVPGVTVHPHLDDLLCRIDRDVYKRQAEHADFCAGKCGRNPTFSYGIPGYGTAGEET